MAFLDRRWLPPVVLVGGVAAAVALTVGKPTAPALPPVDTAPLVRVVTAERGTWQHIVHAAGTVRARTNSDLVPEVSGRVSWISPALRAGGFFEQDEILLRIERRDHEIAAKQALAAVTRARGELRLAQRQLEREQDLESSGAAAQADLDRAIARETAARAAALEAEAELERARTDLERTEIRAPFDGRVLSKTVDVGQFVSRGNAVARLYAIDIAEVSLPVPDDELPFANLHLEYHDDVVVFEGPQVLLRAQFAGEDQVWPGRIVRTEGRIDPRSRMVHVVAEIEDPYGRSTAPGRPPLPVGLFVDAEIQGRRDEGVFVLPRAAMRGESRVLVIDDDSRLRFRQVVPVRFERERAIIASGLEPGDRVCVSPLEAAVDGMRVRVQEPAALRAREAGPS